MLPIANAGARFQPMFVGDVADAFVNALDKPQTFRKSYELAGPRIYTLRELVQFATGPQAIRVRSSDCRPASRARRR